MCGETESGMPAAVPRADATVWIVLAGKRRAPSRRYGPVSRDPTLLRRHRRQMEWRYGYAVIAPYELAGTPMPVLLRRYGPRSALRVQAGTSPA